ncbi:MAG TPA: molybdopterin-dependent oxidoreductase [Pseudolysinimonas sp.]|nr:molybdopterin-dependent oxidoreductase [Pseudolysinimonas sp.]
MMQRRMLAAAAGVASVALGLGVAELVAALVAPAASPLLVVGSLIIDLAPSWAKETAIALFGTGDKVALLVLIGVVLAALAAGAGILEERRPPLGRIVIGLGAILGVLAAVTRSGAAVLDAVPPTIAAIGAVVALGLLLRRLPEKSGRPGADNPDRRTFLVWAGGVTATGIVTAIAGTALQAGARASQAVREAFVLPDPATPAPPVPAGADFRIEGLAPVITPNADFYRIDTALRIPQIDANSWSVRVTGEVENEIELTWAELIALPLDESVTTLMCVSNEVGGSLIGTARWLGSPIRDLLTRATPKPGADMVLSKSQDGFTAGTPLSVLQDPDRNAIFAIGMNGEPLPPEHGFPVRMVVPGLYGYVSATKWVVELEVTRFSRARAYWTDRGWGEKGPIKVESRIDVVKSPTNPGDPHIIAGVAWHQHTGIAKVEVQIDDEPWVEAELADAVSIDTWVQWRMPWHATRGSHTIRARATNTAGETQTSHEADVLPDGATGYPSIEVTI